MKTFSISTSVTHSLLFAFCLVFCPATFSAETISDTNIGTTAKTELEISQDEATKRLNTLLKGLQQDQKQEQKTNKKREHEFLAALKKQQQQLAILKKEEQQADALYQSLSSKLKTLQVESKSLKLQLSERAHHLSDLYSVARQVGRDTQNNLNNSLISAQYPELAASLSPLLKLDQLPQIAELTTLWQVLTQDIQASSQITAFDANVFDKNGDKSTHRVFRAGPFTASTDQHYLSYLPTNHRLNILNTQPDDAAQFLSDNIASNKTNTGKLFEVLIDPTQGVVLARLDLEPSLTDRIQQGGAVGAVIICLGFIGLLYTVVRLFQLSIVNKKINQQLKTPEKVNLNNPLGRILAVYHEAKIQTETALSPPLSATNSLEINQNAHEGLEIKLNEAILREAPKLDRGTGSIKLLATVAPLLGLLGTVTGMIGTFQAITLFGTGDPKLMAGGISQALITTVLGLVVAIPLLFGHSLVASRVKSLLVILSLQSLSLVAQTMETTQQPVDK